jgi:hypothetical protein
VAETMIGPHKFRTSDDGICALDLIGTFEAAEAREFVKEMHRYQEKHPKSALLVVMNKARTVAPDARKLIIAGVREKQYGVCFVGASFAMRALVGLMLNAVRLLGEALPHAFVDTEDEGRKWARAMFPEWKPRRSN